LIKKTIIHPASLPLVEMAKITIETSYIVYTDSTIAIQTMKANMIALPLKIIP